MREETVVAWNRFTAPILYLLFSLSSPIRPTLPTVTVGATDFPPHTLCHVLYRTVPYCTVLRRIWQCCHIGRPPNHRPPVGNCVTALAPVTESTLLPHLPAHIHSYRTGHCDAAIDDAASIPPPHNRPPRKTHTLLFPHYSPCATNTVHTHSPVTDGVLARPQPASSFFLRHTRRPPPLSLPSPPLCAKRCDPIFVSLFFSFSLPIHTKHTSPPRRPRCRQTPPLASSLVTLFSVFRPQFAKTFCLSAVANLDETQTFPSSLFNGDEKSHKNNGALCARQLCQKGGRRVKFFLAYLLNYIQPS